MIDELWNEIEAVVVDGDMTPDTRDIAVLAIEELRSQWSDYEALIALQHRRTVDADRIYQEAHGWPDTKFPDLGELIGWLLEQYAALAQMRTALTQFADRENWQISEPHAFGATNYEWIGDGPDPFEKAAAALASTR